MGREQRNRQVAVSDARVTVAKHRERIIGPVLEFTAHAEACPKCGAKPDRDGGLWDDQFCPGKVATLDPMIEQPCAEFGEHLHTSCKGCGWLFRRKCGDAASGLAL